MLEHWGRAGCMNATFSERGDDVAQPGPRLGLAKASAHPAKSDPGRRSIAADSTDLAAGGRTHRHTACGDRRDGLDRGSFSGAGEGGRPRTWDLEQARPREC